MKDTFSISRLGLLLKKFIKEHRNTYLLYTAGMFGILLVAYGLIILLMLGGRYPTEAGPFFYAGGLIFGSCVFSGSFYSFFNNKAKGIQFLNLPSSHTEKLALSFLFTQLVFFITYLIVFFCVDRIMCAFYDHFHTIPKNIRPEDLPKFVSTPLDFTDNDLIGSLITAITLSSVAHFGSLCFEKNAFIKIMMIMVVLVVGILYLNYTFMKSIIPEDSMPHARFYTHMIRIDNNGTLKGVVRLPENWDKFIYWFLPGSIYVLFWTASYFRLKEKQV